MSIPAIEPPIVTAIDGMSTNVSIIPFSVGLVVLVIIPITTMTNPIIIPNSVAKSIIAPSKSLVFYIYYHLVSVPDAYRLPIIFLL